ncbi:hypothetical protein D9M68_865650 [compost metagenome]
MARNRPISAVRSPTVVVMMVRIPTAPTSSEMLPRAATPKVNEAKMRSRLRSISSWVVRLKSSSPWRLISNWRILSLISKELVALLNTTLIFANPLRLNRLSAQSTGI